MSSKDLPEYTGKHTFSINNINQSKFSALLWIFKNFYIIFIKEENEQF